MKKFLSVFTILSVLIQFNEIIPASKHILSTESEIPAAPPLEEKAEEKKEKKSEKKEEIPRKVVIPEGTRKIPLINVIILRDNNEINYQNSPVTGAFGVALCQEVCPIITTGHLVYNILSRQIKPSGKDEITIAGDKSLKAISWDDWDVYLSEKNDLFLFIPKKYKKKVLDEFNAKEFQETYTKRGYNIKYIEDYLLGFKINQDYNLLKKFEIDKIKELSQIKKLKKKSYSVEALRSIFVTSKDNGLWNIILEGHGSYSKDIPLDLTVDNMLKVTAVKNTKIAGFELFEFRKLIQFFIDQINVNLLYYSTCYGGDLGSILPYITTLINEDHSLRVYGTQRFKKFKEPIKSSKKPNFTIVSGALTNNIVYSNVSGSLAHCRDNIKEGFVNYSKYFELLDKYTQKDSLKFTIYNDKELKEILSAITPQVFLETDKIQNFSSLPSVMFPGTDKFIAVPLDDNVAVLTNALLQKHKIENKPLVFKDKKLILVYPEDISVKLFIDIEKNNTILFSMTPGLSLNKFDNISFYSSKFYTLGDFLIVLSNFFNNTILSSKSPKYYYIKKFEMNSEKVKDYVNDVFIFPVIINNKLKQLNVLFTLNDQKTLYKFEIYAGEIKKKKKEIFTEQPNFIAYKEVLKDFQIIIPGNEFLNAIYNYFYLNPNLQSVFKFSDLSQLLSDEEKDFLKSVNEKAKKDIVKK